MADKELTIEQKLKQPFEPEHIEWRIQQSGDSNGKRWGLVLAYVTNRAIMDRLDEVFGVDGWKNEYTTAPDGGILCGISALFLEPGEIGATQWVTKYDGAENTAVEPVKGGLSNAMKRAAVQWGIGRYLYGLEANFVTMTTEKPTNMKGWGVDYDREAKKRYYWQHPQLPEWAIPTIHKS